MRTHSRYIPLMIVALCIIATFAQAVPFEPVFRLIQVNGDVSIKAPGEDSFGEAQEGKAYPYGTAVRTDDGANVIIVFAENNTGKVGPGASMVIAEGMANAEQKTILLEAGKVEVTLEAENGIGVATPCSSAESVGGTFSVELKAEADLKITVYACQSGQVAVMSDMFTVPVLDADDILSVSCADDQSFVRLKCVKGKLDVSFVDDTGNPRTVAMELNSVVKIWRRKADTSEAMVITILLVAPDGSLIEAINYSVEPEPEVVVAPPPTPPEVVGDDDDDEVAPPPTQTDEQPVVGDDDDDDDDDDDLGLPWGLDDDTTTTTTTTTSTIPSFTAVGKR